MITLLTPNWSLDLAPLNTDTATPPKSFPIEWAYASSIINACRVVDAYFEDLDLEQTAVQACSEKPDTIIVSTAPSYLFWRCPPVNIDIVFKQISKIREFDSSVRIVVIGPHGTVDPKWIFQNCSADYVLRGEPSNLFFEWCEASDSELPPPQGIASKTIANDPAPQEPFSGRSIANYSAIRGLAYQPHVWGRSFSESIRAKSKSPAALVELSRGCPYSCQYCFRSGFRRLFRRKPHEIFTKEVEQLASLGIRYVFFIDETFGMSWKDDIEAAHLLRAHQIEFGLQTRPDLVSESRLELLRDAGCNYIEFGLETLDILTHSSLEKFTKPEKQLRTIELARSLIPAVAVNVFEVPTPKKSRDQTDSAGNLAAPLIPYPGTPWGDQLIRLHKELAPELALWRLVEAIFLHSSWKKGLIKDLGPQRSVTEKDEFKYFASLCSDVSARQLPSSKSRFKQLHPN